MTARSVTYLSFLYLLFTLSCSGDKSIQGFDAVPDGVNRGNILENTFTLLQVETSFRSDTDSIAAEGSSSRILVGQYHNIENRMLLKFSDIPDLGTLTGASISLEAYAAFADAEDDSFVVSVHEVLADWSQNTVRSESFNDSYSMDAIATGMASLRLTSSDTAANNALQLVLSESGVSTIQDWLATPESNNGFLVDFDAANFILQFHSREAGVSTTRPRLNLTFATGDTSVVASEDTYLVKDLFPDVNGSALYVDNSFGHQSVLDFDLSGIPRESVINRAELVLSLIADEAVLADGGMTLQVIRLDTNFVDEASFEAPTSFFAVTPAPTINPGVTEARIPILSFVQTWTSRFTVTDNFGILIRALNPGLDVSRVAFFSSSMDADHSPRMEILYSVAPGIETGGLK